MAVKVPFYRHDLGKPELDAIAAVFATPILTTGDFTAEFERRFAQLTGRRHVLGVTSCTGAMHMALMALGIGPGDEVITTAMSFIATATAILEAGATPVFVDVEPDTGNIDPAAVAAAVTPRTKAILPVHLYGLMCDMHRLKAIAERHGLAIVEDCAHCIEGERGGLRPGEVAQAACYSFFATKNLTCGEGGALAFDDDALADPLRLLRLHGMTKTSADRHREGYTDWDMTLLGWKYNMSNIEAAMLLPQLDRLDDKLHRRHRLAARYEERLGGMNRVRLQAVPQEAIHARHLFAVCVDCADRTRLVQELRDEGVECVVNYRPIHLMTFFRERFDLRSGMFPAAEDIGATTISLPFYPDMPLESVDIVADALQRVLTRSEPAA
jgi:dTDP-4-amino-4,6-dideoxygalactose transaminase